jgi:spoIIIJ-associated protein
MKGKTIDEATKAALEVIGGEEKDATINVLNEGKQGMLGMIGGEDAEVEVILKEGAEKDTKEVLQEIIDKMGFMAIVDSSTEGERILLQVKGEDMGRIIGKEGTTLKALETLVSSIVSRLYGEKVRVTVDAENYREKRAKALERVANDAAAEVAKTGLEKVLPPMEPADRRTIHLFLQTNDKVTTYSQGVGKERRLIISPKK